MASSTASEDLNTSIDQVLTSSRRLQDGLQQVLDLVIGRFRAQVGTIHWIRQVGGPLELAAQRGLAPQLIPVIQRLAMGQGMAGVVAQRKQPLVAADLQQEEAAPIQPRAKEAGVRGSICVPLLSEGAVKGTLGIGKREAYRFSEEETNTLLNIGAAIARHL